MITIINSDREFYYNTYSIKWELLYIMKYREVVFMNRLENWKCIRGIKIKSMHNLEFYFKTYPSVINKDENIYISLAKYKNIPEFTTKLKNRSQQTSEWFKNNYDDIYAYDLLLDFDYDKNFSRESYYNEIKTIYEILLNFGIKFFIIFSGNNYQIIINSEVHEEKFTKSENKIIKNWIYRIKEVFNLKHLDLKGAGVANKIFKCPYSLVENRVVLPIDKLNMYPKEYYEINKITKLLNINLKNRGLMWNNVNIMFQQERFNAFIDKYNLNQIAESMKEKELNQKFEYNEIKKSDFDIETYMYNEGF